MPKTVPQRTCIGCKIKRPKKELIRIALGSKGNITLSKTSEAKGRGAYLCQETQNIKNSCLDQAIKKNAFKYAFKKKKIKKTKFTFKEVKNQLSKTASNCNCNGPC